MLEQMIRNVGISEECLPRADGIRVDISPTLGPPELSAITTRPFRAGEQVFTVSGPIRMEPTIYSFQYNDRRHIDPIERNGRLGIGHYVNHSCDPNTGFGGIVMDGDIKIAPVKLGPVYSLVEYIEGGRTAPRILRIFTDVMTGRFINKLIWGDPRAEIRFVATRDIEPGEEVTFDYATNEYDTAAQDPCRCGAPDCRGRIHGYRDLSDEWRERYVLQGIIPSYLLDQASNQPQE